MENENKTDKFNPIIESINGLDSISKEYGGLAKYGCTVIFDSAPTQAFRLHPCVMTWEAGVLTGVQQLKHDDVVIQAERPFPD